MVLLAEIESDLNQMNFILGNCRFLTYDSYNLRVPDTNEKFITIHHDKFLARLPETFWKLAIIELTKLYSSNIKNDHFSIILFVKFLRRNHFTSSWKEMITSEELEELDTSFKTHELKMRIGRLLELRKQHYAHKDKNPDHHIFDVKFYLPDCVVLIEIAENVLRILASKFGFQMKISDYNGNQVNDFIEKYIELRKIAAMQSLIKRPNS